MKILHLEASPGWGGQEMRVLSEAEGMRSKGHSVIFAVMKKGGLIEPARKAGFVVYELDFRKRFWPICFFQILKIIASHEIDLVNTHSSLDAWIGGIAARFMKRALVRTRHLSTPIRGGMNGRIVYGLLADFVVTTCSSIIPGISKQSRKAASYFRSVPTGVDPLRIVSNREAALQFREKLGINAAQFLVGTACFMRSWKGIGDFLKAADLLRNEASIRWVIIGGGHAETYRNMAKDLKLDSIVFFTGHLENPFPAIEALDAFALLSTAHEGVSQAILQAGFLAKPLIATRIGGLPEVCIQGQTGIQVDSFNPRQVADAVILLSQDRELKDRLGGKAKLFVEERFTMKATLSAMEEVYNQVLNRYPFST